MPQATVPIRASSASAPWKRVPNDNDSRKSNRSRPKNSFVFDATDKSVASREIEEFLVLTFSIQREAANRLWDAILTHVLQRLTEGRSVTLTNIGTFDPYVKKATRFRHPITREFAEIPARRFIRFVMSPGLKQTLRDSA